MRYNGVILPDSASSFCEAFGNPDAARGDPLAASYLAAASDGDAARQLAILVDRCAMPVMQAIVRRRFAGAGAGSQRSTPDQEDAEDAIAEAGAQFAARLMRARAGDDADPVEDLRAYAAVVAYRACDSVLRRRYPARARLKNRIRFTIEHCAGFSAWRDGGELLCAVDPIGARAGDLRRAPQSHPARFDDALPAGVSPSTMPLRDLIDALLRGRRDPVSLDELTEQVARLIGDPDSVARSAAAPGDAAAEALENLPSRDASVEDQVEQLAYLRDIWLEMQQLPSHQCAAVLLNLRDHKGRGVAALLPRLGIASIRAMASAIKLSPLEFADIWDRLPMDDNTIAQLLGVKRQQVIGYRKKARERLFRRMQRHAFKGEDRGRE